MRVIFLCLYPPSPPVDGGRIRTFNILKQVASRHAATLLCFEHPLSREADIQKLSELCEDVIGVLRPGQPRRDLAHRLLRSLSYRPAGLQPWWSHCMAQRVGALVDTQQFELVHVDQILLAQYSPNFPPLPWVLTHHNVEGIAQQRAIESSLDQSLLRGWLRRREHARWVRYEIHMSQRANAIVTVSEQDAAYFRRHVRLTSIVTAPNGVDVSSFRPVDRKPQTNRLLFTGSMDYPPNVDAATWFCQEIFPLIQRERNDLEVWIVGRNPAPEVSRLAQIPGVVVTGAVPDTRPYYEEALVFFVPLRMGGGTRLKILESMSMGIPVISTTIGCEGISVQAGQDLLVADAPQAFAEAVLRLATNTALANQLARNARRLVELSYDWNLIGRQQELAYRKALDSSQKVAVLD